MLKRTYVKLLEGKIITDLAQDPGAKPIFWVAYREGADLSEDGDFVGRGVSKARAVDDLIDQERYYLGG